MLQRVLRSVGTTGQQRRRPLRAPACAAPLLSGCSLFGRCMQTRLERSPAVVRYTCTAPNNPGAPHLMLVSGVERLLGAGSRSVVCCETPPSDATAPGLLIRAQAASCGDRDHTGSGLEDCSSIEQCSFRSSRCQASTQCDAAFVLPPSHAPWRSSAVWDVWTACASTCSVSGPSELARILLSSAVAATCRARGARAGHFADVC